MAKKAGVSIATVSYAINNTRQVSREVKERIFTVMEEIDYQPNRIAGSLRRASTKIVGLIVPDIANPIYAELSRIIEEQLTEAGFTLIVSNSEHSLEKEKNSLTMLRTMRADGVIIIPSSSKTDHINSLVKSGVPAVILDRTVENIVADAVFIDHAKAIFDATEYLIGLGHSRIGYLDKNLNVYHKTLRQEGFRAALDKHGVEYHKEFHVQAGTTFEAGASAMEVLLQKKPGPSAVLAFDDLIAVGALRTCKDFQLDVPNDLSIMGFDDMPLCSYTVPRLSTIFYPRFRMADTACRMLLGRINDEEEGEYRQVVLPLDLVIRETTSFNETRVK